MNTPIPGFSPGSLLQARGRDWVVLSGSTPQVLRVRPLRGTDDEATVLLPTLELVPVDSASFPPPDPGVLGNHDGARLLRDALQLKLRSGAGPFRSFGHIAVEPRAYQLVPLLMALRMSPVRLLVADDVGIGKTIEAGLIVREMLDRDEIRRFAVLCPPHLVEQWQKELQERFQIETAALTASSVGRLERGIPAGSSLFDLYPFVVVSLDYIKSDQHRQHFLSIAPECVVVDEAHTCTQPGRGRHLRHELLQGLAGREDRHLILLTATPHSGDEGAFHNLLALLRPEFAELGDPEEDRRKLREKLAQHFVQRRRVDIDEWKDQGLFPRRMTREITYSLVGRWGDFFDRVQAYCAGLAQQGEARGGVLAWYATLALLRCVASSPAAAEQALAHHLLGEDEGNERWQLFDGAPEDLTVDDLEPPLGREDSALAKLLTEAQTLARTPGDPKLAALEEHLEELLRDGFRPVVFCRYIATAHYVAERMQKRFPQASVEAVTGEYTPEEREERIATLAEEDLPLLVATDCLSEGINLQDTFDAVCHYDLAWNPTRHEQREGRVDRFGQRSREVRCTILYGQDNPVDGFILQVILRKAQTIRRELGILVPLPEDSSRIEQALLKAALLKRSSRPQGAQTRLFLDEDLPSREPLERQWKDALEAAKKNRTLFAQRRLRPEEVLPEWRRQQEVLGSPEAVSRFVRSACARSGVPLDPRKDGTWRLDLRALPERIREALPGGSGKELLLDFSSPPGGRSHYVHRSHPLVRLLAEDLLEEALTGEGTRGARCAVTVTDRVQVLTRVYLLRLRHQLRYARKGQSRILLAEETVVLGAQGREPRWIGEPEVLSLLEAPPAANLAVEEGARQIRLALDLLEQHPHKLEDLAQERAQALLEDHRRVRDASLAQGTYGVQPCLPVDVMGVYVLLPRDL